MDERMKTPLEMVTEFANVSGQKTDIDMSRTLVTEELIEWLEEAGLESFIDMEGVATFIRSLTFQTPDKSVEELKELSDLVYVIYGYARARGYDLDMAVLRVHDNNMGRMYQPDGSILRREDGKIIKNKDYPKVDLSDLI